MSYRQLWYLCNHYRCWNSRNKKIQKEVNCKTTNVVYGIKCQKCDKIVYIGETERTVAERIKEHLADVRHKREKAVSFHFNSADHEITDFNLVIIEKCREKSTFYRKAREVHWIGDFKYGGAIWFEQKDTIKHPLARLPSWAGYYTCVLRYDVIAAMPTANMWERNGGNAVSRKTSLWCFGLHLDCEWRKTKCDITVNSFFEKGLRPKRQ